MKKKKILGFFSNEPLIWFHYVLLTGCLFLGYYLGEYLFDFSYQSKVIMFIWILTILSISDQIIHKILGVD